MEDYIIGSPRRVNRTHYRREDTFILTGNPNSIMVANLEDLTPIYKHWRPGYLNISCSCCYLGIAHSQAKHLEAINVT